MMNLCLQTPCLGKTFSCFAAKERNEKNHSIYRKNKSNSPDPKSYPTLLLQLPKLHRRSTIQDLENVLHKIESLKNGIEINDPKIFTSLLETCFRLKAIDHVIQIHKLIPNKLLRKNVFISSKLLRLYACGGQLEKALEVFDEMPDRKSCAFAWNSLISGYADTGLYEDALALYFQMVEEGADPDQHTFPRVLKACGGVGMIQVGEEIHCRIIRSGFGKNTFTLTALVDMYAKCGNIASARKVFDCIENKKLYSRNSMINGYIKHGLILEAFFILRRMVREGFEPDFVTLSSILTATPPYRIGTQIHGWALRRGIEWDLYAANSLINFYSNINNLIRARWVFENMPDKDVVSWNSIISSHSKDVLALEYLNRMMVEANVSPNSITFVLSLSACANLGLVMEGERIFSMMLKRYELSPSMEHYACMVNLYIRAGLVKEAYELIVGRMKSEPIPAVWGALLYACYLHGDSDIGEIAANHLFALGLDGEHNLKLLMKIYEKDGRYEDAERIRGMMMERGLQM